MRQRNFDLDLQVRGPQGPLAAKALAAATGVIVVNIQKLIDHLQPRALLREEPQLVKTRGRSARLFAVNPAAYALLSVRLFEGAAGQMLAKIEVIDLAGTRATPLVTRPVTTPAALIDQLQTLVQQASQPPRVVVIGLPGVSVAQRLQVTDVAGWQQVQLATLVQQALSLPVQVINDVNAMTYGGVGRVDPQTSAIGLYYPRQFGPGVGIVHAGTIIAGAHGLAGEIASSPAYQQATYPLADLATRITQDVQTLVSLLDPAYVFLYTPQHTVTLPQLRLTAQVQTARDFDDDYCYGLLRLGRQMVYQAVLTQ